MVGPPKPLSLGELPARYRDGCTGPFYGNESDGAPCDSWDCPVCPLRRAAHVVRRESGS